MRLVLAFLLFPALAEAQEHHHTPWWKNLELAISGSGGRAWDGEYVRYGGVRWGANLLDAKISLEVGADFGGSREQGRLRERATSVTALYNVRSAHAAGPYVGFGVAQVKLRAKSVQSGPSLFGAEVVGGWRFPLDKRLSARSELFFSEDIGVSWRGEGYPGARVLGARVTLAVSPF